MRTFRRDSDYDANCEFINREVSEVLQECRFPLAVIFVATFYLFGLTAKCAAGVRAAQYNAMTYLPAAVPSTVTSSESGAMHRLANRFLSSFRDPITVFGLVAVTMMLVFYAFEARSTHYVLGFTLACVMGSVYGFLQGAWPFGLVEAVWSLVALRRFFVGMRGKDLHPTSPGRATEGQNDPTPLAVR